MEFSSPYNTTTPLDSARTEFYAIDPSGNVFHVEEKLVEDKRTRDGQRLSRTDKATGKSLHGRPLMVLEEDWTPDTAQQWMMFKLLELMETVDDLKRQNEFMKTDIDELERLRVFR